MCSQAFQSDTPGIVYDGFESLVCSLNVLIFWNTKIPHSLINSARRWWSHQRNKQSVAQKYVFSFKFPRDDETTANRTSHCVLSPPLFRVADGKLIKLPHKQINSVRFLTSNLALLADKICNSFLLFCTSSLSFSLSLLAHRQNLLS